MQPVAINIMFEEYAQIGKALSNHNRLKILDVLMQSKKTVELLAKDTELSIANVSKHLQILLKARVVKNEKYKNFIFYEIANPMMEEFITHYFEVVEKQWKEKEKGGVK